ncbi:MAG TPA: hypothetical protein VM867_11580 [Xanthobacteraceae bacterium]|nr:hypothetical protein [Xanthobacteraceae bacterium]
MNWSADFMTTTSSFEAASASDAGACADAGAIGASKVAAINTANLMRMTVFSGTLHVHYIEPHRTAIPSYDESAMKLACRAQRRRRILKASKLARQKRDLAEDERP